MIPKIIHHLWIDPNSKDAGLETLPEDVQGNLNTWRAIELEHSQKIWTFDDILQISWNHHLLDTLQAINMCRFPSMQADIARLLLLHLMGGYWADLKLHVNRRFLNNLAACDLVFTEHFPKADLPDPNGRLSNSFIGAAPGNPVITRALKYVTANVLRKMSGSIYHVTGATNLEIALRESSDRERGSYFMLGHETAWNHLFTINSGSYNGTNLHWSLREQRECPYRN